MIRDLDLIRAVLLAVEADDQPDHWTTIDVPGYSPEEVSYHVKILAQAGLIEAQDVSSLAQFDWRPVSLTWQGHEFLDVARDDTRWNRAKETLLDKIGTIGFGALQQLLNLSVKLAIES